MVMDQPVIIAVFYLSRRGHQFHRRHSTAGFHENGDGGIRVSHYIALARCITAAETVGRAGGDGELTHDNLLINLNRGRVEALV